VFPKPVANDQVLAIHSETYSVAVGHEDSGIAGIPSENLGGASFCLGYDLIPRPYIRQLLVLLQTSLPQITVIPEEGYSFAGPLAIGVPAWDGFSCSSSVMGSLLGLNSNGVARMLRTGAQAIPARETVAWVRFVRHPSPRLLTEGRGQAA
jgi:hypothetical protein